MLNPALLERYEADTARFSSATVSTGLASTPVIDAGRARQLGTDNERRLAQHFVKQALLARAMETWLNDTQFMSSISDMKAHPSFDAIVNAGDLAVREILDRMMAGETHLQWFPVLKAITQTDPVPADRRGLVGLMSDAWLKWGREHQKI